MVESHGGAPPTRTPGWTASDRGASGFLLNSSSYEELVAAVGAAAGGDGALSPSVARRHVLNLIGDGLSLHEIATRLVVAEHTVRSHVSRLLSELGLGSRGQAAALSRLTA